MNVLVINETKLDDSFPTYSKFLVDGFSETSRLDRNRPGGRVMIYFSNDIPRKLLTKKISMILL